MDQEKAVTLFAAIEKKLGFVPNLYRAMGANPQVLEFYLTGSKILGDGMLSAREQQAVFLATSSVNSCEYCLAAHATLAERSGLGGDDLRAIREGREPADPRLRRIVRAARELVERRGIVSPQSRSELTGEELLEIAALAGLKTAANYAHHLTKVEIDPAFRKDEQKRESGCCASCSC